MIGLVRYRKEDRTKSKFDQLGKVIYFVNQKPTTEASRQLSKLMKQLLYAPILTKLRTANVNGEDKIRH